MDVNTVLVRLMKEHGSLPAMKLAWSCQFIGISHDDIPKIPPSHYLRELSYTSDERHALLAEQHKTMKFSLNGFKISVEPSIIAFQNYRAGDNLATTITVRNIDRSMQKITFNMDESGPFLIDENSRRIGKYASGLLTSVVIRFNPEDEEDCYHKLIIHVNKTRLAIPVIGLGRRGFLDFPDNVNFGSVPVNYFNKILLPVLNTGCSTARFIAATNRPFGVIPEKGIVTSNDSINLTLTFNSTQSGHFSGFLRVKYDTGEEIHVQLEAEATNQDITFDPMDVEFPDTYIGLMTRARVTIRNNSDIKTKFQWKSHVSSSKFLETPNRESLDPSHKHNLHLEGGGDHGDANESRRKDKLYSHGDSLEINKMIQLESHFGKLEPLYTDELFRIEPLTAEIQPRGSIEILLFFKPLRPGVFFSEAFCEIAGLEQRKEMQIIGRGLGPKFKFGFDVMDVGNVCLGAGHTYEIPVTNISEVEGRIEFNGFLGLMDDRFEIKPRSITLSPGEFSAFFVYYNPNGKPETVFEELRFKISTTDEIMTIVIKGDTQLPTIRFADEAMHFGEVSYGFPESRQVVLVNDSMIPFEISLQIEPDGEERVLTSVDILESFKDPDYVYPVSPQEFHVEPRQFLLSPRGFQRITVTFTPATYGNYAKELTVRIGADPHVVQDLPVTGTCVIPVLIKPETPIEIKCVAGFPFAGSFTIHNPSASSAVFCCVPVPSDAAVISSESLIGIVSPRESITIPFTVTAKAKGDSTEAIEFFVAGKVEPLLDILINCHTISPIGAIELDKNLIELGECKVRLKATGTFKIINSSLVPIPYTITKVKGGTIFEVEPSSGVAIPELADNPVEVSVKPIEVGTASAIFRVHVAGVKQGLQVEVRATGVGCALIFEPELDESGVVDFGYIFTHTPTTITFDITNPGTISKNLEWKREGEEAPVNADIYNGKKSKKIVEGEKSQIKKLPLVKRNSPFETVPMKKVLGGGETYTFSIKAYSTVPKIAELGLSLWAYAEVPSDIDKDFQKRVARRPSSGNKKKLSATDQIYLPTLAQAIKIKAQFALPKLIFSQYSIDFKIEPNPTDLSDSFHETASILAENPCDLPLAVIIHTSAPFGVTMGDEVEEEIKYTFEPKEKVRIVVNFDVNRFPLDIGVDSLNFSGTLDCVYEKHPSSDESIMLTGELCFPTVSLDRDFIDFGTIHNGKEAVQEFVATNSIKFCVNYKIYILANSVLMETVNPLNTEADSAGALDLLYTSSDTDIHQHAFRDISFGPNPTVTCAEFRESYGQDSEVMRKMRAERWECRLNKDANKFFYDKFYRTKLMSAIGLRDPEQQPNDEITYFHYFPQKPPVARNGVIATPNEVIDVVPATGVIQAGTSQKLTVVFYAHSNIHFEAKICFAIENGASKIVTIKGKSIPPPNPYSFLSPTSTPC